MSYVVSQIWFSSVHTLLI